MNELLTPEDIESRAEAAGLSMAEVCRRASVSPSTFTRWKNRNTEPTIKIYRRLRDAVTPENAA